ncbi:MAG: prepilin-type N-terminal cleavage/methylation domain-containing protein [Pseudomonadota bacterium]|nr:prepilin-type N-terminal cleavage/methylation domain-containing protein [Pseudomonadota bacterium]
MTKILTRPVQRQLGFTLIELMVVMMIISVVVSVGMISMGGNEQSTLRAQERSVKALLSYVRDQSALKQQLYLVAADETGLTTYHLVKGRWQQDSTVEVLSWQDGLSVEWEVENSPFTQQQDLPKEGWVFWPSGDVLAGAVFIQSLQSKQATSLDNASSYSFRWNGLLQFTALDEDGFR